MLKKLHENQSSQLLLGFVTGIVFGFLLQKGGVADYNVILDQLLLRDFTVVKIMLTAIVVGMVGIHAMKA
ncbi:MAG: YeeE/YedE family protein, partial [Armatimonadota bacterium]